MSELGIVQFPNLADKTGTHCRNQYSHPRRDGAVRRRGQTDRLRPKLHISALQVTIFIGPRSFSGFLQVALTMKTPKPKQWAEQEIRRLVRLARQGVGTSRIAAELGRHAGSVRRMARTLGLLLQK
ncbi:hypothetical protein [Bradyrhizobium sp. CCBAU 45384]|uniref:hypothetical protein n=1 Tax=Bradyrhizobium sp. CCBAU 45384 TaxID=858428 RepID=UPI0023050E52|nr:hypothetical protein [Bradyrhizobium sp. CCBAU 45384]